MAFRMAGFVCPVRFAASLVVIIRVVPIENLYAENTDNSLSEMAQVFS